MEQDIFHLMDRIFSQVPCFYGISSNLRDSAGYLKFFLSTRATNCAFSRPVSAETGWKKRNSRSGEFSRLEVPTTFPSLETEF